MGLLKSQLRQVFRRLVRSPLFTVVTLITLAAGVGANTVVFSVLEGVLLKPLPYPRSDELISVSHSAPGINLKDATSSPSNYFIYREQSRTFQDIGLYQGDSVSVIGVAEPEQVSALLVTDGIFPILGVSPMLGRGFSREDDSPTSPQTVMLTYGYWRRKFGSDPAILGKSIRVDGDMREIIGVLPQRFHFLRGDEPMLVLPLRLDRNKVFLGHFSYRSIARLKPGVTLAEADADVVRMLAIVLRSFPVPPGYSLKLFEDAHIGPNLRPLKQFVIGDVGKSLWVLMGSIGLVLLIACANVANLMLVRVEGRRQELAIRASLGASWGRIASELLFESVVLGLLGSALGLAVAYGVLRALVSLAPTGLPRVQEIGIDGPVLLFTFAIAVLSSLLFGSIPIFKYAGARLGTGLREGGRSLSQSREQHRARSVLVVVQVALALVLLICSGLMVRTFRSLTKVDPGFAGAAEVQTFRLSITEAAVKENDQVARMDEEIMRKLATVPGVVAVAAGSAIPMDGNNSNDPIFAQDHSYAPGKLPPLRRFKFVTPGFLSTLGTPLIAGRDLTWTDVYNKNLVALVSDDLAREYWQSPANALGKRIRVADNQPWREIIGVVGNVHDDGVDVAAPAAVYWPFLMDKFYGDPSMVRRDMAFALRTRRAGSENLMKDVRQAVWSVDPNLPLADVNTLESLYKDSMARTSLTLIMLAVAGGMALLLGSIGIYGVIAYSVSQRTREIGIRMALGAQRGELTGMFVRHGFLLTGTGVGCGLVAAIALTRLMSSLLFNVNPVDMLTYTTVSVGLLATALLASYLPSRRAATVDPVEALRSD